MRPRGTDDFTATLKERITKFEYAQIGPSARAMANDRVQRLLGRSGRACATINVAAAVERDSPAWQ